MAQSRSTKGKPSFRRDTRRQILGIQRSRIITAVMQCLQEGDPGRLTVARVIDHARLSRKTFYDVFDDMEDCYLAAFRQGCERIRRVAVEAYGSDGDPRSRARGAVVAALGLLEKEPGLARLCVVDVFNAGPRVARHRAQVLVELARALDGIVAGSGKQSPPQPFTGDATAGGILALVHARLIDESQPALSELAGPVMAMIVMPYLGRAAAWKEISASPPAAKRKQASVSTNGKLERELMSGLKLRLTYRTLRVLAAIDRQPGLSNRDISQVAGIRDQGQVSKLLKRLATLELIENLGEGQAAGGPNSWRLTDLGSRVQRLGGGA